MSEGGIEDDWTPSPIELERRAFARRASVKSILIAAASVVVFAGVIAVILASSTGWVKVREAFFDPQVFIHSLPAVGKGLLQNLKILAFSVVGVAFLGTLIAVIRTSRSPVLFPLRFLAAVYVDIVRGMPAILLLYLIGLGIPGLRLGGRIDPVLLGTIAITICYSAYVAEVLRSGINSIHPSQRAGARALGLSHMQTMRIVILPQAIRNVIPALMNDFVSMQKDVGLVSIIGVVDAVRAAQIEVARIWNFTPYVAAGVVFILFALPFVRLADWYTKKVRTREQRGGTV
ncbi:MAG: amino acid ABC transporter permease [Propionibacteriaceae bacterium]|jgi:polar amino acid transport system permease protein|nr:amino acid ABC transporter permease [Propionibacteriaceae bacterium]